MSTTIEGRHLSSRGDLAERIERLPASRWFLKIKAIVAAATFFDAYDAIAIAFTLPVLIPLWKLSPTDVGILISAGFAGQIVGAAFFGWFSERFGRIVALQWTIGVISLFGLASALAWGYWPLVAFRFLQGLGIGGEVPVAATYVSELSSPKTRGQSVLFYQFSYALGFVFASLGSAVVVPALGWEWVFILGAAPAFLIILLRRSVPESPRWLIRNGRFDDARNVVARIESIIAHEKPPSHEFASTLPRESAKDPGMESAAEASVRELFGPIYLARTISVWIMWFCAAAVGYGLLSWLPSIFRTVYGMSVQQSLIYSILGNVTIVAGALLSAFFIDKVGRRFIFISAYVLAMLVLVALWIASDDISAEKLMVLCAMASTFIAMAQLALWAYTPEIYPTRLRSVGTGLASAWARVASVVIPLVMGAVLTRGGVVGIFLLLAVISIIGATATFLGCIETKNRSLEDIAPDNSL